MSDLTFLLRHFGDGGMGDVCRTCREAADEIERLRAALREAWPYVPEHHGPVQHKIREALASIEQSPKCAVCGRPASTEDCERDDCGVARYGQSTD